MTAGVRAFVLAAGKGTRLGALTGQRPKALAPIGDRPAIAHALDAIRRAGIADVTANVFHHRSALEPWLVAAGVRASVEHELLGTAGGLRRAVAGREPRLVLVYNADIFAPSLDLADVLRAHARGASDATLVVRSAPEGSPGNVGVSAEGRVVRLRTTAIAREAEVAGAEFLGIHVMEPVFALPETGCLVGDVYLASPDKVLRAFVHDATAWDIGTPASYLAANLGWLARTGARVYAGEGALLDGVHDLLVAGAGSRARGRLDRVVLWPGTAFEGDLRDAVVTPAGVVDASG